MDLYNLKKNKLEEVNRVNFKLEKEIQTLVEENVETLKQKWSKCKKGVFWSSKRFPLTHFIPLDKWSGILILFQC